MQSAHEDHVDHHGEAEPHLFGRPFLIEELRMEQQFGSGVFRREGPGEERILTLTRAGDLETVAVDQPDPPEGIDEEVVRIEVVDQHPVTGQHLNGVDQVQSDLCHAQPVPAGEEASDLTRRVQSPQRPSGGLPHHKADDVLVSIENRHQRPREGGCIAALLQRQHRIQAVAEGCEFPGISQRVVLADFDQESGVFHKLVNHAFSAVCKYIGFLQNQRRSGRIIHHAGPVGRRFRQSKPVRPDGRRLRLAPDGSRCRA